MADNTQVASGTGDSIRDKDRSGVKTQIVGLDVGVGTTTEALMSATNPAPTRLTDGAGGYINRAYGPVRVSAEEQTLFLDTHDQTLDTTNRWVAATGANGPTTSSSVLTFGTATTASAFGKLTSQPSFTPQIPGFLQASFAIKLDAAGAAATNGHRFWGVGTSPTTPATTSASTKLTDAIGWEVDTDGKMYAVTYAAGVRTAIDLSASGTASQPLDGSYHRYLMQIRTDRIYWFIDSLSASVATVTFITPTTQTLPVLLQTINPAASVAAGGYPLLVQGSVIADTAGNSTQLSDGTYPWRKATVKPASTAVAATDLPIAVGLHPTSALPAGTASIGTVQQAAITKGTQGTTGVSTQDLKDSGRTTTVFHNGAGGAAPTTSEASFTCTGVRGGVIDGASATAQPVTSGKRLRLTGLMLTVQASAATQASALVRLRWINTGNATVSSPLAFSVGASSPAAVANSTGSTFIEFPEGFELSGTNTFALTLQGIATGLAFVQLIGYEY